VGFAEQSNRKRQRRDGSFHSRVPRRLSLPGAAVQHTGGHAWSDTLHLADHFRLSLYDVAYLELAQRRMLPLATLDHELRAAARAVGTKTFAEWPATHMARCRKFWEKS
jgi:predicted nucleic acid-binding protein